MEIANCRLRLNKVGSDVPLKDVTPAEAMFLHIIHGPQNGGMSFGEEFSKIEVVGTAQIDTGKTKKVVTVVGQPEKIVKGKLLKSAVPAQTVKGKQLTPATLPQIIPAVGAIGLPGTPEFVAPVPSKTIPAVAATYEPDIVVPAQEEVREADTVIPAVEEKSHEEKILSPRTDAQELKRLSVKYNGARNKKNEPIINTIWPDKLNPKLPQNFKDIDWTAASELGAGTELGGLNYATGGIAQTAL